MNHLKAYLFIYLFIIFFITNCAVVSTPTGGPIDTEPPKTLKKDPQDYSINVKQKSFIFYFDEFFVLKKPHKYILVNPYSPNQQIDYYIKNKMLFLKFSDSLLPSTTYTFQFDSLVADFREGNVLKTLRLVFSTGLFIDSLKLSGKVLAASSEITGSEVLVYLFPNLNDSLLLKPQFCYIVRSKLNADFTFENLPSGKYYVFVLSDIDGNNLYSRTDELIGFLPNEINLVPEFSNDTLINTHVNLIEPIRVFRVKDTTLFVKKFERVRKGLYRVIFSMPVDTFRISLITTSIVDSFKSVLSASRDTCFIWFAKQSAGPIKLEIWANWKLLDTITYFQKESGRIGDLHEKYQPLNFKIHQLLNDSFVDYKKKLSIISNNPIIDVNCDTIFLIRGRDTLFSSCQIDKDNPNLLHFDVKLDPYATYKILIPALCVVDLFGQQNEEQILNFKTTFDGFEGKAILVLSDTIDGCFCIEAMIAKRRVFVRCFKSYTKQVIFDDLVPGVYSFRIFLDNNCNEQWDTGDFYNRILPEPYWNDLNNVLIKSNWDCQIEWFWRKN